MRFQRSQASKTRAVAMRVLLLRCNSFPLPTEAIASQSQRGSAPPPRTFASAPE